ncbi:MAG TPA: helix-turn-helix domain-containing protein [Sphingobium sp.]
MARPEPPDRSVLRQHADAWRRGNVGRSIFNAFETFERDLLEVLEQDGFGDVRRVQLALYRNLDFDGTRLKDLAHRAAMTKQGMQDLVDRAEKAGYVARRSDPRDGRAKIIVFDGRGLALLDALHRGITYAQTRMEQAIGEMALAQVAEALDLYVARRKGA